MIDGHRETWPIRSKRFRAFLRRSYYQANSRGRLDPGADTRQSARENSGTIRLDWGDMERQYLKLGDDQGAILSINSCAT